VSRIIEPQHFRYARSGEFKDEALLGSAKLKSTRYELAVPRALKVLENPDLTVEQAQEVLALVQRVRAEKTGMADSWKCQLLKVEGLAYDFLGADREALAAFDQALRMDPKVGVKRKRDAIAKQLAKGG
jgi:tetratricopeptide (TPR) repeat protein